MRIPSPQGSMLVVASCCWDVFHQQGLGKSSEMRNEQMQGNPRRKPAPFCRNLREHWHKLQFNPFFEYPTKNRHLVGKSYSIRWVSQQLLWHWWYRAIRNSVKQMYPGLSVCKGQQAESQMNFGKETLFDPVPRKSNEILSTSKWGKRAEVEKKINI